MATDKERFFEKENKLYGNFQSGVFSSCNFNDVATYFEKSSQRKDIFSTGSLKDAALSLTVPGGCFLRE